jgi:GntR family transcriptional repressor for pyruvate dehydrogenase complex
VDTEPILAIRPLRRGSKVSETVARDIVRRIGAAQLPPGTQLPAEAQMLADYGVGRASLREALRILEVHGLISIKPGPRGGPVVAGAHTRDFGRMSTLYFQVGGMTFRELIEARLILEPVMARLAAERRDPDLLEKLMSAGTHAETDGVTDDDVYLQTSSDFHRLVAEMAGNSILYLFSHSLEDIFHDRVSGMLFPVSRRGEVVSAHSAIANAIARGQASHAEKLMRDHMTEYANYVKRRHPALWDEVVDWR